MKNKKLLLLCLVLITLLIGCKKDEPIIEADIKSDKSLKSCEGCHTNYAVLKAVHTPDSTTGGGGCGGDIPHIEPFDRVFLGGDGFQQFKNTIHGKLECTTCHNGVGNTDDKKLAHSAEANFIKHPSQHADAKCASCHPDIYARTKNSLHEQGWGQKNMVISRGGFSSFANLPENLKKGYDTNCGKCHASCGDCHVNRPVQGGGGLANGHLFVKTPDMRDKCITCHVSRGGHAYLGVAAGTVPDVHLTKAGYTCMNCHSKNEIHGDGQTYEFRYQMALLPKCEDCHQNLNNSNVFHTVHINTFNCQTCHSQDYNNCGSCHIGGDGARIVSHQKFKIALNPIKGVKPYKFATVRQSLMAPDSWSLYGVPLLANFDVKPTYKYTTPHNIIKRTSRTNVTSSQACYDNCHIVREGTTLRNKNLYLFNSDLNSWEINANREIVVDGKLPPSWQ